MEWKFSGLSGNFGLIFKKTFFQVCKIEMVLGSTDANSVVLIADEFLMWQQTDMNLFVITEYFLGNMSYPKEGVKMVIKFRRKIMSEMMTTYLPSVLLMMITFATTFFNPFFFEAALSVNLTTMLVMTTIFISKMEGLPPTSDIKMIDIWLILCQLVPFVQVVLLTAIEYLREKEKDRRVVEEQGEDLEVGRGQEKGADESKVVLSAKYERRPQEAWVPMKQEPVRPCAMQKFLTIGRLPGYL